MNRTQQAIRDLNDLVSVRDQLTAEEWLEQVYPVAVSAQHKTASGKTVEFLPEIWGLIKEFMIVFPSAEEAEAKKMSGKDLTTSREPAGFFVIGDYQFNDDNELHSRTLTYMINGVLEPYDPKYLFPTLNFFWVDTVKRGMNWRRGEKIWFRTKQNVDDYFFPVASRNEREVCWDYCIDEEGFILVKSACFKFTGQEEPIGFNYETRVIERTLSTLDCHYNNWWKRLTNRLAPQQQIISSETDSRI